MKVILKNYINELQKFFQIKLNKQLTKIVFMIIQFLAFFTKPLI